MKKGDDQRKISYCLRNNYIYDIKKEKSLVSFEGKNAKSRLKIENQDKYINSFTPEKNKHNINNLIDNHKNDNIQMVKNEIYNDTRASNNKSHTYSDCKITKSRLDNSSNCNNINNVNNNNLNFQMNFLINESQTSKLNFPQTTKFNNLLDKEGFKHIMDLKYSKNKLNNKPTKRDQSSTKIQTQSNNPNSILSIKSDKNGVQYQHQENLQKNIINNSDLRNIACSYETKNQSNILFNNGKVYNLNTSLKNTIDYLKEYEEKLKEHLKKNLKEKLRDKVKVDEIIEEMHKFSRREILKIPIKEICFILTLNLLSNQKRTLF